MAFALALISGGLDSLLAVRLLRQSGVELECVHFVTGFNHRSYSETIDRLTLTDAWPVTHVKDLGTDYVRRIARKMAGQPATRERERAGGCDACRLSDPGLDCRALMLQQARALADQRGIELLVTGEVLGQGARGQRRADFSRIEEASGALDRVWRPLSCAYLPEPPTVARGLRAEALETIRSLGRIQGRSRRGQFALAEQLGLGDYPKPAGGCCRLTDPRFVRRLQDDLQHRDEEEPPREDLLSLAIGRHFRIASRLKVIVGRDAEESAALLRAAGSRWAFQVDSRKGAVGLVQGDPAGVGFEEIGGLAARYSAERNEAATRVRFHRPGETRVVVSRPAGEAYLELVRV